MSDYSQGKVYLIYIPGLEEVGYIGSTVIPLNDRLRVHRHTANSEGVKYKFASCVLFEDGNEVCIKQLEAFPCETKQQLLEREKYWLGQYPDAVNKNPPILTEEERKIRHKEVHLTAYNKKKDHNLTKHREWIEANKEQQAAYKKARFSVPVVCSVCNAPLKLSSFWNHRKAKHPGQDVTYTLSLESQ